MQSSKPSSCQAVYYSQPWRSPSRCPKCLHTLILVRDLEEDSTIWVCYRCPYYGSKPWLVSLNWSKATKQKTVSCGLTNLELERWTKSEPSFDNGIAMSLVDLEVERRRRAKARHMQGCMLGMIAPSKLKEVTDLREEEVKPLRPIRIEKSLAKRITAKLAHYLKPEAMHWDWA